MSAPAPHLIDWIHHLIDTAGGTPRTWAEPVLARRHQLPPLWLDLCAAAAQHLPDGATARQLCDAAGGLTDWFRLPHAEEREDPWHEPPAAQVHRCAAVALRALGQALPLPDAAHDLDPITLALRDAWLARAARAAVQTLEPGLRWQPPPAAPGLADVDLPVLLVTQIRRPGAVQPVLTGVQAHLTLRAVPAPGAHLRLVAAPRSACTALRASMTKALQRVQEWLWATLLRDAPGPRLADLALCWDLHFARPHGDDEPGITSLGGPSAGAALAVAAAKLLQHAAPPGLATLLQRLSPDTLRSTWITAALRTDGTLDTVGSAGAKRGTLALMLDTLASGAGRSGSGVACVHAAEGQSSAPDDPAPPGAAPLQEHADIADLLGFLARGAEPPDAHADALMVALLGPDERPAVPEAVLTHVAAKMATPTLSRWLLKCWAQWARRAGGEVHARYVPLAVQPGARGPRHPPVAEAKAAARTLEQLLADYDATGHQAYVLRGRPGAGKTTLLRHHLMALCRQALRHLAAGPGAATAGAGPVELPLYLPLAGLEVEDAPLAWARTHLRQAGAPAEVLAWLDPLAARPAGWQPRLMLDGINELKVQPHELREDRAAQVLRALCEALAGPPGAAAAGVPPCLLSIRQHHADSLPGIDLLRVDLQDWSEQGVRDYLALRFPAPPGTKDEDSPWWQHWQSLAEPRHRAALALCRVPLHLAGQCDLWAHGFSATLGHRAALYTAWLWLRLRRALGHHRLPDQQPTSEEAEAAKRRGERWRATGLLTEQDCRRIASADAWLDPHPDALPLEGTLLPHLMQQAETQYWADAGQGRASHQRCARVDVPVRELGHWITDATTRQAWLEAVAELGLLDIDQVHGLAGFAHQSWGEYLASVRLLPATPPAWVPGLAAGRGQRAPQGTLPGRLPDVLAACEAARFQPPGGRSDAEEVAHLNTVGSPAWQRVLPLLLPFADADARLEVPVDAMLADRFHWPEGMPREQVVAHWRSKDAVWFDDGSFELDAAQQQCRVSLRRWGDTTGADEALGTARPGEWAQRAAGWQFLVHEKLRLAVRDAVWSHLARLVDPPTLNALREQPGRLQPAATGDIDEVLSLALAGLRRPAPWLAWWLAAGHGLRLGPAVAALCQVLEGEPASPSTPYAGTAQAGAPPAAAAPAMPRIARHSALQHWRRLLLLQSLDAGSGPLRRLRASPLWARLQAATDEDADADAAAAHHRLAPQQAAWLQQHWQQAGGQAGRGTGLDLRVRLQAARLLGGLGDTLRFRQVAGPAMPDGPDAVAEHAALCLHDNQWLSVGRMGQPTVFCIGAPRRRHLGSERPVFNTVLPGFQAAALPVTVAEWRSFIDAGGCRAPDLPWWKDAGPAAQAWLRRQLDSLPGQPYRPWFWDRPGHDEPLLPATGIRLFEALAFARWVERLLAGSPPPAGTTGPGQWQVRLPTELQWEALARGPRPRPGSPEWLRRALLGPRSWAHRRGHGRPPALDFNHAATRWGRPSPVGVFSRSQTPQGLHDAAGNVWEWCSSRLDKDMLGRGWRQAEDRVTAGTAAPEADGGSRRALRGGAFLDASGLCRPACRGHGSPGDGVGIGVRLVRCWLPHSGPRTP